MAISKVQFKSSPSATPVVWMDVTQDTVQTGHLENGYTAHDASGSVITGTLESDDYEWRKPAEWPDLESVTLPNSWELNTMYLLYDKTCGIDDVYISGSHMKVYKGTITNNAFVGEVVNADVSNFTDTLTDTYTVYKIEQTNNTTIMFGTACRFQSNYPWMNQGCVWIYAELPLQGGGIGGSTDRSLLTPYMKRMNFTHVQNMYPTFPENLSAFSGGRGFDISVSYVCGYTTANDWNSFSVNRTGNGPITPPIKQKSVFEVKNVNFQSSYTRAAITARNLKLTTPSGVWKQQQYQSNSLLEKFVCKDGTLVCDSMYYQFYYCPHLTWCDLSGLDFSSTTNSSNAFTGCSKLQTLILNNKWKMDLNLSSCPTLSHESAVGIFNVLPTIETTKTITLHDQVKYFLTAEEIAVATAKGWTVA